MLITKKSPLSILRHLKVINSEFLYIYIYIYIYYANIHICMQDTYHIYILIYGKVCVYIKVGGKVTFSPNIPE